MDTKPAIPLLVGGAAGMAIGVATGNVLFWTAVGLAAGIGVNRKSSRVVWIIAAILATMYISTIVAMLLPALRSTNLSP